MTLGNALSRTWMMSGMIKKEEYRIIPKPVAWFQLERGAKKSALVVTFASEPLRRTLNLWARQRHLGTTGASIPSTSF